MGQKIFILVAVLCLTSCGSTYSRIETPDGPVYIGMAGSDICAVMGSPDMVSSGRYTCRHAGSFPLFAPGFQTIEWAWVREDGILVAYLDDDIVRLLGIIR